MMSFELVASCILILLILTGLSLLGVIAILTIDFFKFLEIKKENKKSFDDAHPIGFTFVTNLKQKFPYGKWKYLGKEQNDCYLYERIK